MKEPLSGIYPIQRSIYVWMLLHIILECLESLFGLDFTRSQFT